MTRTALWGDRIALHYRLFSDDGVEAINTFDDEEPVILTLGNGEIEPNMESCLIDLEVGRRYTFKLEAEQAFGLHNPEMVMELPLDAFADDEFEVGSLIEFTLPEGDTLPGQIIAKTSTHATVDFNHPLSGCLVNFEVMIIEILES
ncbi:MAG: FKBP-type peptidyl-prolyl cis-trans isomerase [Sulfuricella denitrificans]|nr:FKBP-type peptidyl-prolyl cis-trans isomerase [Sulfuricella denitrificans]